MPDSYLVAQIGDTVRIDQVGPLYGTYGVVVDERGDSEPSLTARVCTVLSDGGSTVEIHADYLEVIA